MEERPTFTLKKKKRRRIVSANWPKDFREDLMATRRIPLKDGHTLLLDEWSYRLLCYASVTGRKGRKTTSGKYAPGYPILSRFIYDPEQPSGPRQFLYPVHRLVYALHMMKDLDVDHINGDTFDARLRNLRLATSSQNAANRKNPKTVSKHGFRVLQDRPGGRYSISVSIRGKLITFGGIQLKKTAQRLADAFAYLTWGLLTPLNDRSYWERFDAKTKNPGS